MALQRIATSGRGFVDTGFTPAFSTIKEFFEVFERRKALVHKVDGSTFGHGPPLQ